MFSRQAGLMCLLLALLFGQFAIAQHSTTHINHGYSYEVVLDHCQDHKHDYEEEENHSCPECILTKSLQTAFYHVPDFNHARFISKNLVFSERYEVPAYSSYSPHFPRAPPHTLI